MNDVKDFDYGKKERTLKELACKIITDSGLSSNSFDGFNKTDDDNYETPGFDAAKSKIIINISGGISDFKVHRY